MRVDFFAFYQVGGAIGFDPRTVDKMSLQEFQSCYKGWKEANGIKTKSNRSMSEDRLRELGIAGF